MHALRGGLLVGCGRVCVHSERVLLLCGVFQVQQRHFVGVVLSVRCRHVLIICRGDVLHALRGGLHVGCGRVCVHSDRVLLLCGVLQL